MARLFGTNGVRGVANSELTVELVTSLATSIGTYFGGSIAVGRDGRSTSSMFRDAVVCGLISVGCNVYDAGMLPTPALQHSVKENGLNAGIMITASHNPSEFNGLKVIAADGVEASRSQEAEIEEIFFAGVPELSPWDGIGTVQQLEVLKAYQEAILSHVDIKRIRDAGLKVAIDPGNGVAAFSAPGIARALASRVTTLNVNIDGRFPNRDSEPRPDNLGGLQSLVMASGADLGVAYDGDGDRSIFVDERGEAHWGDRSFALIAREYILKNPGRRVASPVNSSRALEEVVSGAGGSIVWTQVGSVVVSRKMIEEGIPFGGEENGGIMYGPHLQVRDGSMALALVMEIMAEKGKPLSELLGELPQYYQLKVKVPCPERIKRAVLRDLRNKVDAPRVETIDGVKLIYNNRSWVLFRPSGTEPIFRIYAEAESSETVEAIVKENKSLMESVIDSLS
ncbi:MAG: phosphoglucosamine mutase [Candidatus Bathyarchaeota archaeon]|jgi:phosphomannomutase/phosphoglucomutase|nr:phosphoglucosamine mutase [Candidatus Bathyarchaeota archaeon]